MVNLIEQQIAARKLQYADKPIASEGEALIQNYHKGIVAGLRLALAQPQAHIDILREQFMIKLNEERDDGSQQ